MNWFKTLIGNGNTAQVKVKEIEIKEKLKKILKKKWDEQDKVVIPFEQLYKQLGRRGSISY